MFLNQNYNTYYNQAVKKASNQDPIEIRMIFYFLEKTALKNSPKRTLKAKSVKRTL